MIPNRYRGWYMAAGLGLVSLLIEGCGSYFKTEHGIAGFWCFGVCSSVIAYSEWISEQKGPEGGKEKAKAVVEHIGTKGGGVDSDSGATGPGDVDDVDGDASGTTGDTVE